MSRDFLDKIEASPIIAAVKDDAGLDRCLTSDIDIVFVLYGDLCTIPDIVKKIKKAGRCALVHMDLVGGLASKDVSLDYIRKFTEADGIITTKSNLIPHAKSLGLYTVLRYFVLDSMTLESVEKNSRHGVVQPDVIEILPGILPPKMIREFNRISRVPVICGGLIRDKEDVMNALSGGAAAISTTNQNVWFL